MIKLGSVEEGWGYLEQDLEKLEFPVYYYHLGLDILLLAVKVQSYSKAFL